MATSQYIGPSVSVGGAVPAGTGTEVQYRSSGSAFGAVATSSWDGSTLTLPQLSGVGIGTASVAGRLEWPEMHLFERAATGVYANPQLVLADPTAGASLFVFHPYGTETLSFEPGAIFSSNASFTLRAASGGSVQLTDADAINVWTFDSTAPPRMRVPVDSSIEWDNGSLLKDVAGVVTILSFVDSVVFQNTGIEFSDFAIHPQSAEDGSVGTAALPFGSVFTSLVSHDSGDLTLSTTTSGDVNVTSAGAINLNSNANVGGAAGVRLSAANGILTLLGLGDGADENLLLDFNTTANTVLITSGTGVTKLDFGSIILEGAFSAADGSAGFTGTACTAFKNGLCVSGT